MSNEPKRCPCCDQVVRRKPYEGYGGPTLLMQTPQTVWQQYKDDGYTIAEAIKEEWGYA